MKASELLSESEQGSITSGRYTAHIKGRVVCDPDDDVPDDSTRDDVEMVELDPLPDTYAGSPKWISLSDNRFITLPMSQEELQGKIHSALRHSGYLQLPMSFDAEDRFELNKFLRFLKLAVEDGYKVAQYFEERKNFIIIGDDGTDKQPLWAEMLTEAKKLGLTIEFAPITGTGSVSLAGELVSQLMAEISQETLVA